MTTVVLATHNVANCPEVGGHFWVYLQYALGLRQLGCDVYWLEWFTRTDPARDGDAIATFLRRLGEVGLGRRIILLAAPPVPSERNREGHAAAVKAPLRACSFEGGLGEGEAEAVFRRADLLLNFHYSVDPALLARFRRTALVDIDPGLLQIWMHHGLLDVAPHDVWLTTGETVGVAGSPIPDCGRKWHRIRPCVSLEHWPVAPAALRSPMTTVSSWDGGEWATDADGSIYENNKRVAFLDWRELPRHVDQALEIALFFRPEDERELDTMRGAGWTIRHSREVAGSPEAYRAYIQRARAEFSCAKPSCTRLRNAWVSDRTLCFLASGKPAVVQHTGPSSYLPDGEGLFRFSNVDEAVEAIEAVNADYERHCRAARAIAEEHFDARKVTARILEVALGPAS